VSDASNSTIGPGNVVSGNGRSGIVVMGKSGYQIIGNVVGPKADRTGALGNTEGIDLQVATNSVIGGTGSNGNLISGNSSDGVLLFEGANSIEVTGNTIDSNAIGVDIASSSNDTIHGNSIVSNTGSGIEVVGSSHVGQSTGDRFYGNTTIANGGLGINLFGGTEDSFGVTANDAGDADAGPNGLQNFPVITSAVSNSKTGVTVITGTLNSMANQLFTIDLYLAVVDPSGHGEGETTFGSKDVTTGANSSVSWQMVIARVPPGTVFTSTATQLDGDGTSEFSANTVVTGT